MTLSKNELYDNFKIFYEKYKSTTENTFTKYLRIINLLLLLSIIGFIGYVIYKFYLIFKDDSKKENFVNYIISTGFDTLSKNHAINLKKSNIPKTMNGFEKLGFTTKIGNPTGINISNLTHFKESSELDKKEYCDYEFGESSEKYNECVKNSTADCSKILNKESQKCKNDFDQNSEEYKQCVKNSNEKYNECVKNGTADCSTKFDEKYKNCMENASDFNEIQQWKLFDTWKSNKSKYISGFAWNGGTESKPNNSSFQMNTIQLIPTIVNIGAKTVDGMLSDNIDIYKTNINKFNLNILGFTIQSGKKPAKINYNTPSHYFENGQWKLYKTWITIDNAKEIKAFAWNGGNNNEPNNDAFKLEAENPIKLKLKNIIMKPIEDKKK